MLDFSSITTRGGDEGKTSLLGGERRSKSDHIFEILGTVDELTSQLGVFRAQLAQEADGHFAAAGQSELVAARLLDNFARRTRTIQEELQKIGGLVALPISQATQLGREYLGRAMEKEYWDERLAQIEEWEQEDLPGIVLTGFIIPGDTLVGAIGDLARAVCRRLERLVVHHVQDLGVLYLVGPQRYLNRLSDLLFIMSRALEKDR